MAEAPLDLASQKDLIYNQGMRNFQNFIEHSELSPEDRAMWETIMLKAPKGAVEAVAEYINEIPEKLKNVTEIIRLKKKAFLENDTNLLDKVLREENFLIK
ncbi:MAG: hypothetical protein CEN90_528 [Parcubacteria group bacterium Licking1014_17]|nr:MAG: hypothetical protein CEN90_528 [Parcubacteria group bacterium Licking1014_17]